ncbi:hypothetical protein FACS189418_0310 [Clostridia bacterium]|nr:hypothetical protein FACS189418_0310 [Clostridia bacterium]
MSKPAIRFAGFNDEWEWRKFTDITYLAGEKNRENLPLESYSITNESGFIPQNEQFENGGTMRDADKTMYYIVSPKSFAYNPARINVGSIGYQDLGRNVIVSSLYEVFKTIADVDDRFLWHWFKTDRFRKMIEQYQEGGVRLYFYYDKLCRNSIALPSIAEQARIGRVFDRIDHLLSLHQQEYDKLAVVKKSLLQKMFPREGETVPEIRFAGFTVAWEQCKAIELCSISTGKSNTQDRIDVPSSVIEQSPKCLYLSNKDLLDKEAVLTVSTEKSNAQSRIDGGEYPFYVRSPIIERSHKYLYDEEAVLTVGDGVGTGKVFHYVNGKYDLHQRVYRMFGFNSGVSAKYFYYYFSSHFYERVMTMTAKTSVDSVRLDMIADMKIVFPSEDEQTDITALFDHLDYLLTIHQRELSKLQKIKKALLQKMFPAHSSGRSREGD